MVVAGDGHFTPTLEVVQDERRGGRRCDRARSFVPSRRPGDDRVRRRQRADHDRPGRPRRRTRGGRATWPPNDRGGPHALVAVAVDPNAAIDGTIASDVDRRRADRRRDRRAPRLRPLWLTAVPERVRIPPRQRAGSGSRAWCGRRGSPRWCTSTAWRHRSHRTVTENVRLSPAANRIGRDPRLEVLPADVGERPDEDRFAVPQQRRRCRCRSPGSRSGHRSGRTARRPGSSPP